MTDGQDGDSDDEDAGGTENTVHTDHDGPDRGEGAGPDQGDSDEPVPGEDDQSSHDAGWQDTGTGPDAGDRRQNATGRPSRHAQRRRRFHRADRLGEPATGNGEVTEQTVVEREPVPIEEYTTDRRSLTSVVQVQWVINTAIVAVVLGLITTAALTAVDVSPQLGALSILVFLVLGVGWVALRYRVWVYQIREDAIYLERGVVTHVRTLVPYVRIQHVDTSRGPVERALGLSTLVVYTAGSRGADVSIPGLRPHEASDLQQRIKELAIEAEGDDAL